MTDDPINRLRFRPPYVGQRGWLGVWLDVPVDWDEVRAIVADAHQLVASARRTRSTG